MMNKKLSSSTSILKQLPKGENIYKNIKSPMDVLKQKESKNTELSTQINNFQKEPNTNFMSSLQNRVPPNTKFSLEKPVDYGLSKDLITKGQFSLENSGTTSSLLNKRISNNGTFKQSNGIPSLNAYFGKFIPKDLDYRYVDPQTYEYKLKGMTQDKLIKNAMQEEGLDNTPTEVLNPDDPDYYAKKALQIRDQKALEETLDPTTRAKRWREQTLADKATKIQKVFRGFDHRQNVEAGEPSARPEDNLQDTIQAGKAIRRQKTDIYQIHDRKDKPNREKEKERRLQLQEEGRSEEFVRNNPNLTYKQAIRKFAEQNPNYQHFSRQDRDAIRQSKGVKNDPNYFTERQKTLQRLQNTENPKLFEEDIKKEKLKAGNKIAETMGKKTFNIINRKNLKDYQEQKKHYINSDSTKAEKDEFEKWYVNKQIETSKYQRQPRQQEPIQRPIQRPQVQTRGMSKASQLLKREVRAASVEPAEPADTEAEFIDDEPKKEDLTEKEQITYDKNYKKYEETIADLKIKTDLVETAMKNIEGEEKTTSRTRATESQRKMLKEVYSRNGENFSANKLLGNIYKDLQNFKTQNNAEAGKNRENQNSLLNKIIKKRGSPAKTKETKEGAAAGGGAVKGNVLVV